MYKELHYYFNGTAFNKVRRKRKFNVVKGAYTEVE